MDTMSGTASRFIGRYGYDPILRVGMYPAPLPPAAPAPVPQGVSPVRAMPAAVAAPMQAPAPVMAGSMREERLLPGMDGGNGGAQGDYGGPGPSGVGSTGSFLNDLAGFANAAGPAAVGMMGGPMGITGLAAGAMASGLAAALGYPETSSAIARAIGFSQGPGQAADSGLAGIGDFNDVNAADFAGAPTSGQSSGGGLGSADGGLAGMGDFGDSAGQSDAAGATSGHSSGEGLGGTWQKGGYTGPGHPAEPAGTVHKGEVVIPAEQVQRYGLDPLLMLARGQVEPTRLSALLNI
jgi:hypothetical protein